MDIRICLLLTAEAGLALVLLWRTGVLPKPAHVLCAALLLTAAFVLRGACLNYITDDYRNFLSVWVDFFRTHGGLAALRAPVGNYNLPYLTVLALISDSSLPDLHLIKLLSILFDVLLAWSVMQLVGLFRRSAAWKLAAFFLVLFWPTVVLNGALWGQCDSVYAALAVLSVYLVLSGHPLLGVISIGASFSFKLQAVFVMPVFLLFWLTRRVKLRHALAFPAVCVVMVLPAGIAGRGLWDALTIPFQQTGSIGTGLNYNSPSVFALFRDVANPDAAARLGIGAAALVIAALAVCIGTIAPTARCCWRRRCSPLRSRFSCRTCTTAISSPPMRSRSPLQPRGRSSRFRRCCASLPPCSATMPTCVCATCCRWLTVRSRSSQRSPF